MQNAIDIRWNSIPIDQQCLLPNLLDSSIQLKECRSIIIDGIELEIGQYYAKKTTDLIKTFFEIEAIYMMDKKYYILGKDVLTKYHKYYCTYVIDKKRKSPLIVLDIKTLISGRTFKKVIYNDCEQILCYVKLTNNFKVFANP